MGGKVVQPLHETRRADKVAVDESIKERSNFPEGCGQTCKAQGGEHVKHINPQHAWKMPIASVAVSVVMRSQPVQQFGTGGIGRSGNSPIHIVGVDKHISQMLAHMKYIWLKQCSAHCDVDKCVRLEQDICGHDIVWMCLMILRELLATIPKCRTPSLHQDWEECKLAVAKTAQKNAQNV